MPIKTEVVPVHTEEGEAVSKEVDAEKKEEEPKQPSKKQIPKAQPKRVSKKAAPQEATEQATEPAEVATEQAEAPEAEKKSRAKAKSKDTADLSQKTKCPICKRVVTTHCLLYTHKCPKAALDEKKKILTVEEESAPPPPKLERAQNTQREMKQWVEENPCLLYTSPSPRDRG